MTQTNSEVKTLKIGSAEISVEIADNPMEQYQGLSGRESLCDDCGMLFVFSKSEIRDFTMRGMKFPLDFIFIRNGEVVELRENVPYPDSGAEPERVVPKEEADMVLEVNQDFISNHNIQLRDKLH